MNDKMTFVTWQFEGYTIMHHMTILEIMGCKYIKAIHCSCQELVKSSEFVHIFELNLVVLDTLIASFIEEKYVGSFYLAAKHLKILKDLLNDITIYEVTRLCFCSWNFAFIVLILFSLSALQRLSRNNRKICSKSSKLKFRLFHRKCNIF